MAGVPIVSQLPVTESFTVDYLEYYRILPLELTPFTVRVAVAGEPNREALEDLVHSYSLPVELVPVEEDELRDALRALFSASESVVELVKDLNAGHDAGDQPADVSLADIRDLANQAPVVRFVSLLIRDAYDASASDIHLEATRTGSARLRVDGVLVAAPEPPSALQPPWCHGSSSWPSWTSPSGGGRKTGAFVFDWRRASSICVCRPSRRCSANPWCSASSTMAAGQ